MLMIDSVVVHPGCGSGFQADTDIAVAVVGSMRDEVVADYAPSVAAAAQAETDTPVTVNDSVFLNKGILGK